MKRTFLAIWLALSFGLTAAIPAAAKTPPEVLKPYKAYRVALKADQKKEAADYAYEAWMAAEKVMGDSKTTGDLAANFAELSPAYINEKRAWRKVMKAHKRSIELAALHSDNAADLEIERRIKYQAWVIPTVSRSVASARDKKYDAKRLQERIVELGFKGSVYEAEAMAFRAQTAMIGKDWKEVVTTSEAAIDLFDKRTDRVVSVYEYAVPLYLARAHSAKNQPIDAALTYQNLMDKLEVHNAHDNAISSGAYGEWIRLRDIVAEMKSDDPRAQKVVSYTVPDGRAAELSPLIRKPPVFPSSFLRGNKSGWVKLKFSVDENGFVTNPTVVDSSAKSLQKASLECVKEWRYSPNADPEKRENL